MADVEEALPAGANVVGEFIVGGRPMRGVDRPADSVIRPADSVIRGLHYVDEGLAEDEPPAGDILNPDAVASFIALVYDRYHAAFGSHFGNTIGGIFTDGPNPLGRCRETGVWPGTTGILEHVSRLLGGDFAAHLPALWFDDWPDAEPHRERYRLTIRRRLEETRYRPLSEWCERNGTRLCGHPNRGDEIGSRRYFHVPGQDVVWRWVEPDKPTAIEGPESTQAKASSSAALHLCRDRNSNEFCGAFGPETTLDEVKWIAHWLLVRGVNLLIPHAFYDSVRGPRRDERPPQLARAARAVVGRVQAVRRRLPPAVLAQRDRAACVRRGHPHRRPLRVACGEGAAGEPGRLQLPLGSAASRRHRPRHRRGHRGRADALPLPHRRRLAPDDARGTPRSKRIRRSGGFVQRSDAQRGTLVD